MAELSLAKLGESLSKTWPARLALDALGAMKLPGDVYQGNVSMYGEDGRTNPEVINRSLDLAGLVTGGSYAAPAMKDASGMGIRAYHGSPHDFDKFDLSKIGTGEGAQAYGHGLYFAENEGTAKSYREALSRDKDRILETGGRLPPWVASTMESRNPTAIEDMRKTFQTRIAEAEAEAKTSHQPWLYPGKIQGLQDVLKSIDEFAGGANLKPAGRMYEVNINADPAHFLDWDKKIRDMPPEMRDRLLKLSGTHEGDIGSQVYHRRVDELGQNAATQQLNEAGIPGVKYLDGGSRGAGQGSSNYVVFNDKLIDIMRKYGMAVPGAAGAAAYAGQDQGQSF